MGVSVVCACVSMGVSVVCACVYVWVSGVCMCVYGCECGVCMRVCMGVSVVCACVSTVYSIEGQANTIESSPPPGWTQWAGTQAYQQQEGQQGRWHT